ncbi:HupE/UreJ family protein [Sphingobium cloacae]|uniref:HupE/UreJ family protein n=1 Tax=Sphingobium cloacae TaxID=120107 RepID=A0A1E1EYJ8_9SPHN|nr:HupE/UreJ family protein [Sphingobium cloacae]BAV63337.1 hypothetical protein SCLO_1002970 [Sphingobium cloacae]
MRLWPLFPRPALALLWALALGLWPFVALAHDVAAGDRAFVQGADGPAFLPFLYLGAKHMVTGYDHILFLAGVVFYLTRLRDVLLYVSLFTLGHSATLLSGVLLDIHANSHLVDAVIGLSVVYKGVENIGGFQRVGLSIDPRVAVLLFGLVHGLGLATKLGELGLSGNGLMINLVGFNLGVELGQCLVLAFLVTLLGFWRSTKGFARGAFAANLALIACGILLTGHQITRYLES